MIGLGAFGDDFQEFQILHYTNPPLNDLFQMISTKNMTFSIHLPVAGAKYEIQVQMKIDGQYGNPDKLNVIINRYLCVN